MSKAMQRAWCLTRHPGVGWDPIAADPPTVLRSIVGFLLPGAIVVAACSAIGLSMIGLQTDGFGYKMPWAVSLKQGVLGVGLTLAIVWLAAWVASRLAPWFGGQSGFTRATAAVAHAGAPVFLAAAILLWPKAAWLLGIAGLWSVYVLHRGLRAMMAPRETHAIPYTLSVVAVVLLLAWLLSLLTQCSPARVGQHDELAQIKVQSSKNSGPAPSKTDKRKVNPEDILGGKGGSGAAPVGQGSGGAGDLEVTGKAKDAIAAAGTGLDASANSVTTRSVLESFLPGELEGFKREIVENHAFSGKGSKAGEAATFLMRGALVKAMYKATDRSRGWRSVAISDLTPEHGQSVVNVLLQEIVRTGGENVLPGGRQRYVEDTGTRMVATEHQPHREPAREFALYETILGNRYRVVAESQGLTPDALREWVLRMDLKGLEERARTNKPIE